MKKLFCIVFCVLLSFSMSSCKSDNNENIIQQTSDNYKEIIIEKSKLKSNNRDIYAKAVLDLSNKLIDICSQAVKENKIYQEYFSASVNSSKFAVSAYEEYITCKYQGGSIGFTLIADYQFFINKQITQNIISLLKNENICYPIEHNIKRNDYASNYFEEIENLSIKISNCNSPNDAKIISIDMDKLIATLQEKAEIEINQSYSGVDDNMTKIVIESFNKMLDYLSCFQEENQKVLELLNGNEIYVLKSQLYAQLEKAIFLYSLI